MTASELRTDVCIVGAGPAGLTLALLLIRSGVDVVVFERSPSLDREYRGEILQPGGLAVLDQLGVLAPARERGSCVLSKFQLVENRRTLLSVDYRMLAGEHNYLLSLPQRHLIEALLEMCQRYDEFTYLAQCRLTGLLRQDDEVRGAVGGTSGADGRTITVHARCVVGADGRFSKTRQLAGIENVRMDIFGMDVLWFKLPADGRAHPYVQIFRAGGNPLLAYHSWPDSLQLGWTLPHGSYPAAAALGIGHIKTELAKAAPPYAELIEKHVTGVGDLSLLDVFAAHAARWAIPGLVLIGDSAHTHSPLGAQGINLAIQDAVVLHPILVAALGGKEPTVGSLDAFQQKRDPDIKEVMKLQQMQSKGMLSQGRIADFMRPKIFKILPHTPMFGKTNYRIAYGNPAVRLRPELFIHA